MRLIFPSVLAGGALSLLGALAHGGAPGGNGGHGGFGGAGMWTNPPAPSTPAPIPSALRLDAVPPVPAALAHEISPYGDFGGTRFVAWHPLAAEMLVMRRAGNVNQLFALNQPLGRARQLTHGRDPVRDAQFEPRAGEYILFTRDTGGDEATQLFRLDPKSLIETALTPHGELYSPGPWNSSHDKLIVVARPLDRPGRRAAAMVDIYAIDPLQPEARFKLASLAGGGWRVLRWLDGDNRLVLSEVTSGTKAKLWLLDMATGRRSELNDYEPDLENASGRWLYRRRFDGDVARLTRVDLHGGDRQWVTRDFDFDIESWSVARSGGRIAALANVAGGSRLRLYDGDLRAQPVPPLPPGIISAVSWHRNGRDLAVSIESAESPAEVYVLNAEQGSVTRWSAAAPAPKAAKAPVEAEPIVWRSFDQMLISGFIYRPPGAAFPGRRPVVIALHGGPESLARPGFRGRTNFWINERGYAVIYPNVRGSAGFGRRFMEADNLKKREDAARDVGALLDWIATQPDLDASRVAVTGVSYGGFLALATAAAYPNRVAAAVSSSGISHFVSLLEGTESYRRDLARAEYGDERDPDMRQFLDAISPLANAERIRAPLLVCHGRNDPRVPWTEAEQIVRRVRAGGTPVWYALAEDEGHGFSKKSNVDYLFAVQTMFLDRYLAKKP